MAFNRDITNIDVSTHGVVSCPDRMTGTAAQNKQRFDELVREVVKEKFNGLIDDLEASTAAGNIGFSAEGYEAENVKDAIEETTEITKSKALISEGWAVGKQDGVDVPQSSPYYHNNAKYFAEQAGTSSGYVSYVSDQGLNEQSKQIARENIDAYKKPASGIPSSDLSSAVNASLGKADTALQEHQYIGGKENKGKITVDGVEYIAKSLLCNRNLLDNPWFTVNQRGVTTYSVGAYGVDRWKLISGSASVSNNKITLNGTLRQILENSIGNSFTASVLCESGTATATYDDTTKYFDIVSSGGVIKAAKLELGSISTLANDTAPNYAEELMKCQRYFFMFKTLTDGQAVAYGTAVTSNLADFMLPITMRATPSVTFSALRVSSYDVTNISANQLNGYIHIRFITNGGLTVNNSYVVASNPTAGYFCLSADL